MQTDKQAGSSAAEQPDRADQNPAVIDVHRTLSFPELSHEIDALARALHALGAGPRAAVAVMLHNRAEYIAMHQAALRVGACFVQIGTRLRPREVAQLLADASPRIVVAEPELTRCMAEACELADRTPTLITVEPGRPREWISYTELVSLGAEHPPLPAATEPGSVITYTSGTTGRPKGATRRAGPGGQLSAFDLIRRLGVRRDERHLIVCPLYHSAGLAFYNLVYRVGGTCVLLPRFDAEAVLLAIERERITSMFVVPTLLQRLATVDPERVSQLDLSSLRWVCASGAPLATAIAVQFQDTFGPRLWNLYGSTEAGMVSLAGPDDHVSRPGTVGRPLAGNTVRIVDEQEEEVPVGTVGQIQVHNDMLVSGYQNDEEASQKAFRGGFFRAGDLGRLDEDGNLYLVGRVTDMVISGGVNIYPREIEEFLLGLPGVAECAVTGVPDPEWGERLRAFIVLSRGATLQESDILSACRQALAGYKVPRDIQFVHDLPHTPTGKVMKHLLGPRPSS
jgi:fatty-acyl-CoA synthase